jgi:hypothetical protein
MMLQAYLIVFIYRVCVYVCDKYEVFVTVAPAFQAL